MGKGKEREGLLQLCFGGIIKFKIEDCMSISVHLVCITLWGGERFLKALGRQVLDFRFQISFWIFKHLHICNYQNPVLRVKFIHVSYTPDPITCRLTGTTFATLLYFDWTYGMKPSVEFFY